MLNEVDDNSNNENTQESAMILQGSDHTTLARSFVEELIVFRRHSRVEPVTINENWLHKYFRQSL